MSIYICGACNCGKAEIARRLGEDYPNLEVVLDPSETIFDSIFGVGLDRVFRGRKWESKPDEAIQGIEEYLDVFDREDIICNESPLLFLSHILYFGVLSVFSDEVRAEIISRCLSQLRNGHHFIVRRWSENGNFARASMQIQRDIGAGRKNIHVIPPADNYENTVTQGYEVIKAKLEVE